MKSVKYYPNKILFSIALGAIGLTLFVPAKSLCAQTVKPKKILVSKGHANKAGHGAHVHGSAKLTVALETPTTGTLLLESPGDSIVGFEHAASTGQDKKMQAEALAKLTNQAATLFAFEKSVECSVQKTRVEIKKEDHHESAKNGVDEHQHQGEHNEVEAEYKLTCQKSPIRTQLTVTLGTAFPRVKKLQVQVLGDQSQSSTDLPDGNGSVKL